ncbi:hypothetical protein WJX72_000617 [[Myrmecia] bisecta]|uniref:Uncharacterized protein n=1 Tax=[Myrmecia] bisecta TaxID=41462 RepID=A0AAW1R4C6_9CHLO
MEFSIPALPFCQSGTAALGVLPDLRESTSRAAQQLQQALPGISSLSVALSAPGGLLISSSNCLRPGHLTLALLQRQQTAASAALASTQPVLLTGLSQRPRLVASGLRAPSQCDCVICAPLRAPIRQQAAGGSNVVYTAWGCLTASYRAAQVPDPDRLLADVVFLAEAMAGPLEKDAQAVIWDMSIFVLLAPTGPGACKSCICGSERPQGKLPLPGCKAAALEADFVSWQAEQLRKLDVLAVVVQLVILGAFNFRYKVNPCFSFAYAAALLPLVAMAVNARWYIRLREAVMGVVMAVMLGCIAYFSAAQVLEGLVGEEGPGNLQRPYIFFRFTATEPLTMFPLIYMVRFQTFVRFTQPANWALVAESVAAFAIPGIIIQILEDWHCGLRRISKAHAA